jgi:hypothetical protein
MLIFIIIDCIITFINHDGNAMPLKTSSIKGFLILSLLAGLTTFLLASFSFARKPIRRLVDLALAYFTDGVDTSEQIQERYNTSLVGSYLVLMERKGG